MSNRLDGYIDRSKGEPVHRLGRIFKALSDETRLTIMGLVFRHEQLCVCEVEQILGITQSKASRHLRYLRDAGVLEDEREGLIVNYRLPARPDAQLRHILNMLRGLIASEPIPDAGPLLVQIRSARTDPEPEGRTER
jgi:ArsR family transcriptional regulator